MIVVASCVWCRGLLVSALLRYSRGFVCAYRVRGVLEFHVAVCFLLYIFIGYVGTLARRCCLCHAFEHGPHQCKGSRGNFHKKAGTSV